jgi:hypothetical protein
MPLTVGDLPKEDLRPLLLLDVDGVLNAINNSQNHKLYNIRTVETPGGFSVKIRMRHELTDWIFELTEYYVPVWCTMWGHDANLLLAPLLELPDLPVIECSYSRKGFGRPDGCHDKVTSIEKEVSDRAFAWLDDEITSKDLDWACVRTKKVSPTKFMKITETFGLQRFHVDRLMKWAEEIA